MKLRGFRIELEEVERVCSEANGVGQAAVVVKKGQRPQEHLVAYITPAAEGVDVASVDQGLMDAVVEHFNAEMSAYIVPTQVDCRARVSVPSIGGKVYKRGLPEPDSTGTGNQKGPLAGTAGGPGGDEEDEEIVFTSKGH